MNLPNTTKMNLPNTTRLIADLVDSDCTDTRHVTAEDRKRLVTTLLAETSKNNLPASIMLEPETTLAIQGFLNSSSTENIEQLRKVLIDALFYEKEATFERLLDGILEEKFGYENFWENEHYIADQRERYNDFQDSRARNY